MSSKLSTIIISILISSGLAGCGREPPKCSDEETFSLVRKIILDQIGGSEGLSDREVKENMEIDFSRASAFDEKIKRYNCEAKLIVGGAYELPITYESQLDDNSKHIVSVGGIGRGDLLALQQGMILGIQKSRAANKPPEAQSAPKKVEQSSASTEPTTDPRQNPATTPTTEKAGTPQQSTWVPSFDCAKASTFAETAVCTDVLLGRLDGALAENYKFMLAANIGDGAKSDLKATQKKWLAERNTCTDKQCLVSAYRKRTDEICEYPVITGVHPVCNSSDDVK